MKARDKLIQHNNVVFNESGHYQMNRNNKNIKQTYNSQINQGDINPNHVSITERMVVIDSQFRNSIIPYSSTNISSSSFNTNFSVDLSDPLNNVLSIELYSIQIPQTWYNISLSQGNSGFTYVTSSGGIYYCKLDDGFYNIPVEWSYPSSKVVDISDTDIKVIFTYDTTSMRVVVSTETSSEGDKIVWHSDTEINTYWSENTTNSNNYCSSNTFTNNNLGWSLGFRTINEETGDLETLINDDNVSIKADAACSLYGPQYLILCLDDYQHNRLNRSIVGTVDTAKKLDLPSYNDTQTMTRDTEGNCVAVITAPRNLTQAQLYTINSIYQNRLQKKNRIPAPTTNNVLAIIPIQPRQTTLNLDQTRNITITVPITILGSTLMSNAREYFGPVNIERLGIKLVDDKGFLVDLNGSDWSFILKIKQLYQY
jgi:hypothetical protein